jgi:hypothetical protein
MGAMKFLYFLILVPLSFLVACGPVTPSETIEAESQTSLSPTSQAATSPTEKTVMDRNSSPVATPTREQTDTAQTSPIATPSPARSANEETRRETDKANVPADNVAVIFHRSGGFAGMDEQWTIYRDGRITTNNGREAQITPEQVEQLLMDIETLGFFEMSDRYMPLNTCCDRFTYVITVRSDGKVNTVTTIDAASNVPQTLWQIIDAIGQLIIDASK